MLNQQITASVVGVVFLILGVAVIRYAKGTGRWRWVVTSAGLAFVVCGLLAIVSVVTNVSW